MHILGADLVLATGSSPCCPGQGACAVQSPSLQTMSNVMMLSCIVTWMSVRARAVLLHPMALVTLR